MVRNHRANKLRVAYSGLGPHADPPCGENGNRDDRDEEISPLRAEHMAHENKHQKRHRRDHHHRHVDIADVEVEMIERGDHRVHHEEHHEKVGSEFEAERQIAVAALAFRWRILVVGMLGLWLMMTRCHYLLQ